MPDNVLVIAGIACHIQRKAIKNLYLRVKPPGQALISAPHNLSRESIVAAITPKIGWIQQKIAEMRDKPLNVSSLEQVAVWGEILPVRFVSGHGSIGLENGALVAALPKKPAEDEWLALLSAWRKDELLKAATPLLEKWRLKMGLAPVSLGVRAMKKRWGSCYPRRSRIILNSELAARPLACLEVVIVHELAHCLVPNHSKDFYQQMDKWLPNWRKLDDLLK